MMRLGFFSPLPPSRSGIADYSAELLRRFPPDFDVETFDSTPEGFDPGSFDLLLYQIGNNPFHAHAYRMALRHPGVVVLHEFNLHHLIADLTIKHGDWDAYMEEVAYDGGAGALEYARRVRALEVGPDYEGVPMMRRILSASKGIIVHSRYMANRVREAGFEGPLATIPHGAWLSEANRMGYRQRLGIDEVTPLIGVFGFLKPYKKIAESLRALRRLRRVEPRVKMILVGEPHPELPLDSLLRSLELSDAVRVLGFTPMEDFSGYLAATDIVVNLRCPTVGESSGTLLRALGMGKPALVSEIGSFQELPDDICLKVPVDSTEEDLIFQYLNLLVSREDVRREIGGRARQWVKRTCAWDHVAKQYAGFLQAVAGGREWAPPAVEKELPEEPSEKPQSEMIAPEQILTWAGGDKGAEGYIGTHIDRLQKTLELTPPGGPADRVLEMGAYLQITPSLKSRLGYGEVRGCYYGEAGEVVRKKVTSADGDTFECEVDLFDAEKDRFPYPDEHFTTVLCCELIEHLFGDPMHMMSEINRVLKPGGHLVLTTPNIGSLRAISAILTGYHPGFFPAYLRPAGEGGETDARHNREYTPKEVARLLIDSGFEVERLETGPFRDEPAPEHAWVIHLLERYMLSTDLRGEGVFALGKKTGPLATRYPDWLYD